MIAMASHGRGMTGRLAFGSVADRIARCSAVPVLIVRPGAEAPGEPATIDIRRIVVPLDGSEVSTEALPVAVALARSTGAPVRLIQTVYPSAVLLRSSVGTSYYPREFLRDFANALTTSAAETLQQAESDVTAERVSVTRVVAEGAPAAAIEPDIEDGDLIVMTSHGRSGLRRWLLSSVAEKQIRSGKVPVVLVPAKSRVDAVKRQQMDTSDESTRAAVMQS
jgi:nucleotide-binding universal stress UspA family protein